ncbi:hypothetical protein SERLA73DRAFT_48575, partial [Serpula lacrymans var. lacrymans S7.3]
LWMVQQDVNEEGYPAVKFIHVDCILRAAHLLPIYGDCFMPRELSFSNSLDAFHAYYVNKFIDHHAFGIAS